jgi:hypothetical protein
MPDPCPSVIPDDPDAEVSVAVASVGIGHHSNTLYAAVNSDELPARRDDDDHGKIYIRVGDLSEWLTQRAAKAAGRLTPLQRARLAELLMRQSA